MRGINESYLSRLKKMRPEKRLLIALELSELVKAIAMQGIRASHKHIGKKTLKRMLLERMGK